jgi:hypothetical protein
LGELDESPLTNCICCIVQSESLLDDDRWAKCVVGWLLIWISALRVQLHG